VISDGAPSNSVITVSAALGNLRAKYSFKLDVRTPGRFREKVD